MGSIVPVVLEIIFNVSVQVLTFPPISRDPRPLPDDPTVYVQGTEILVRR